MSAKQGLLIVISGPAGSGKGTMLKHIFESPKHGRHFVYSVSATTRAPRPGEVDGVNYHSLTREDFEARIARGDRLQFTNDGNAFCDLIGTVLCVQEAHALGVVVAEHLLKNGDIIVLAS